MVVQTEGGDLEPVDVIYGVVAKRLLETPYRQTATCAADSQGHDWASIYSISRTTYRDRAILGLGAKEPRRCTESAVLLHHMGGTP
jgi:hypothetical protein